ADARAAEEAHTRRMAEAKAAEERKRRRLTLALAASLLLLVVGAGGGWLWVRGQREARGAEATRKGSPAVAGAPRPRGPAESAGWSEALSAARRAAARAEGEVAEPVRQHARGVLADVGAAAHAAKERAASAEKERRLVAQLLEIRSGAGDRMNGPDQDFPGTD